MFNDQILCEDSIIMVHIQNMGKNNTQKFTVLKGRKYVIIVKFMLVHATTVIVSNLYRSLVITEGVKKKKSYSLIPCHVQMML